MLCYVTQYINIIHILLLVTFMDIFHGHIFLGYYFLMVIQRRMDQSMKRGMEQSNAMGWMVEKPWMTLLVGFIYIYPRYPKISPQEKDRNKKSGFLAACLFVQSSEYPKALVLKIKQRRSSTQKLFEVLCDGFASCGAVSQTY